MLSRRQVLFGGLGALGAACLPRLGLAMRPGGPAGPGFAGNDPSPFLKVPLHPDSIDIDGIPFAPGFTGDRFPNPHVRFPSSDQWLQGLRPPHPSEHVKVAVVGGGISGLASAYMLRAFDPVVLEGHPRFGGNSQGEIWGGVPYSLGGAYIITPDRGTFLDELYQELGLSDHHRLDDGDMEIELEGQVVEEFWKGAGLPKEQQAAFAEYAKIVTAVGEKEYPEIPLPEGRDNQWILDLDMKTLKQDIEDRMTHDVPPLLASAIQAYCYSSFGAGWEEISAAGGWNFLAAEEYGRWVFRGGNATIVDNMFKALAQGDPLRRRLRAGAMVVDVRQRPEGVQVTWLDWQEKLHSLLADRVVMSCPKHVCKYVLHDLEQMDAEKLYSMQQVTYAAYVVANVLLDAPVERDFYDIFLLGDGDLPQDANEAQQWSRVADMLNGRFAAGPEPGPRSVLTLYWPLPFHSARFSLFEGNNTVRDYGSRLVPHLQSMLELLEVDPEAVRQVRLTAWGHAMPLSLPNFIAEGHAERVRRPIDDRIYFVQEDNWALPAVENCLLDAAIFTPQIATGLG